MREIALANNIGCSTLHSWVQQFKSKNKLEVTPKRPSEARKQSVLIIYRLR
jgi:transposase-like protein